VVLSDRQLIVSFACVGIAFAIAAAQVFVRSPLWRSRVRRYSAWGLGACALVAVAAWTRLGDFHSVYVDAPGEPAGAPGRHKVERHLPLHFHEFFHYYLGAKYFAELGYGGLYDCTTYADAEIAREDGVPPKIRGYIRDLDDVLRDKTYGDALQHCGVLRARFSDARWTAFKNDQRELRRLVPDDWWGGAVSDAGFNPPPSWCLLGGTFANAIPLRAGGVDTFLLASSLDLLLLAACFIVLRSAFGDASAAMAGVFFGATFIASYMWNGGAFLRYTWITAVVLGIVATRRGRWGLAGVLFGLAACDRIFPLGFAVGAALPLAWRALKDDGARRKLARFGAGLSACVALLVTASLLVYGASSWETFFVRILRHGDVYYVMHIGLKKVLVWRDWVPSQNFWGHAGLARFHEWNVRLAATWKSLRLVAIPIQLGAIGVAAWAAVGRRPYEASLLVGVVAMFFFEIPANYYYVVLALVPALLLRAATVAPTSAQRQSEFFILASFVAFWLFTLDSPRIWRDDIVYNHWICVGLLAFLGVWLSSWAESPAKLRALLRRSRTVPTKAADRQVSWQTPGVTPGA
jgi:hypothetical protein